MAPERPLGGLLPPIPTPFDADGEVAYDRLLANLERWNREPLDGYVVGGSNGEFVFLSAEERVEVVRVARQAVPADRWLLAGTAAESTRETIALTERMAQAGADAALVVTPFYYKSKMTPEALEAHYRQVADASPIPVLLYSVPVYTGLDLPAEVVVRLAEHPNILGIKDSGGNVAKMGYMVHQTPPGFRVLTGSGANLLGALAMGAVGAVSALANIAARRLAEVVTHFSRGEVEAARQAQLPLIEVNTAVTARYGIAGLKAAMDMVGYYGGPVRAPLLPLPDEDRARLRTILARAGLL